jgi:hypothetical protein
MNRLERGDILMSEASYSDVALVYIISGELTMLQVSSSNTPGLRQGFDSVGFTSLSPILLQGNVFTFLSPIRTICLRKNFFAFYQAYFSLELYPPEM